MDTIDNFAKDRAPRRAAPRRGKRSSAQPLTSVLAQDRDEDVEKLRRVAAKLHKQEADHGKVGRGVTKGGSNESEPEPGVSMVETQIDDVQQMCATMKVGDEDMWKDLFSGDKIKLYAAVKALRVFLDRRTSSMRSPSSFVLTNFPRVYQRLIELLGFDHTALQYQALCCIHSICLTSSGNMSALVRDEVVVMLVNILTSGENYDVRLVILAAKCLGLIGGDNSIFRSTVVEAGGISTLVSLITPNSPVALQRACGSALHHVSSSDNVITFDTRRSILPALNTLMYHSDERTLIESCLTLCSVCSGPEMIQKVVSAGFLPRLIQLLQHQAVNVQKAALIGCDSILTGRHLRARALVKVNILPVLSSLLEHDSPTIRKRVCALLSNLICTSEYHIEAILLDSDHMLLERLMSLALKDQFSVALWSSSALANAVTKCTEQQFHFLESTEIANTLRTYMQKKNFIVNGDIIRQALSKLNK